MESHNHFAYASDQTTGHHHVSAMGYSSMGAAQMMAPLPLPPQTMHSSIPPQAHFANVAPINTQRVPTPQHYSKSSSSTSPNIVYSSKVGHQPNCTVYCYDNNSNIMEQKVRQFYSADGTSFIEHVPGHCLVFIPNSTNVDHVLRELRKVRQPKPQRKPKEKSTKPTNAFIKYRNHKIEELKSVHPEISQTDISRMAGECWKTEKEEVKGIFRRQYMEEKRIYDMNKAKRARHESEACSDTDVNSDTQSTSSHHTNVSTASRAVPHGTDTTGLSLGLGFGLGGYDGPAGFNPSRRRSHTLPSGGFTRSSTKRRISQELRKHLASKNNAAYITAAATASAQTEQAETQKQPSYEFTFTPPQIENGSTMSSVSGSPYLGSNVSPLVMPINPGFPISDFTTSTSGSMASADGAPSISHHHTRSLTNIPTGLTVDTTSFASQADGFEAFTPDHEGLTSSLVDAGIAAGLSMMNTTSMTALSNEAISASVDGTSPFLVDTSASVMTTNALSSGYLTTDTPPLVSNVNTWPLTHAYSMVSDNTIVPQ
ncbi:hypothetical protein GQ54DRAFT_296042 [Martensiomyces pterosporus]|nr:hypothetical protein GQ54DRAFT_296042 [Martensiomyces pterosporus]